MPATSVTVTVPVTAAPSAVRLSGLGDDVSATPERLSAVVKGTLTLVFGTRDEEHNDAVVLRHVLIERAADGAK